MREIVWSVLMVLALLCTGAKSGLAQSSSPDKPDRPQIRREAACHLEFSIIELEDGKKINVRHYSMNLTGNDRLRDLKIGSRIPVESEQGKFQYLDIGTSIQARIYGNEDPPILDVSTEISSVGSADQTVRLGQPIVRQMVISGSTLLVYDKLIAIGAADDPNSKRQYQLEVTATKIR
jgi:hypothetical protein